MKTARVFTRGGNRAVVNLKDVRRRRVTTR
jgi:hypothetical protein